MDSQSRRSKISDQLRRGANFVGVGDNGDLPTLQSAVQKRGRPIDHRTERNRPTFSVTPLEFFRGTKMRLRTRAKTVEEERQSPKEPDKPDDDDARSATPESDAEGDDPAAPEEPIPVEAVDNARKSKNTDTVQQMWEVPAVAHFCSLFRATFKLIDFDIEDLEEALIIDTDCADQGGRSSLLVDLLIGLLKGCIGRRDITLLNYNQFLHDLLELQWVTGGMGVNPLGLSREKANFHILPVYAKAKLLHKLCEWRLERPDVETLTKNLTGESLRVNPLGEDDQGNTYWYFYGTRLYKEEPEPVKIRISTTPKKKKRGRGAQQDDEETASDAPIIKLPKTPPKTAPPLMPKKRKRRPVSYGSSSSKRKKRKVMPTKNSVNKEEQSGDEKIDETMDTMDSSRQSTPSVKNSEPSERNNARTNPEIGVPQIRRQLSTRAETVARSGRSSPCSETNGSGSEPFYRDLIQRIYSHDEDEDTRDTPMLGESGRSSPSLDDTFRLSAKKEATANDTITTNNAADQSALTNDDTKDSDALLNSVSDKGDLIAGEEMSSGSNEMKKELTEATEKEAESSKVEEKKPSPEPVGPPPYDQEALRFNPTVDNRWCVVCKDVMDWRALAELFRTSRSKLEKMLHSILKNEFLPSIEEIYAQKEKEKEKKMAALIAKRTSDRLEVKRLQREEEIKELEAREKAEWERIAQLDLERRRKAELQTREQRQRQREIDRDRQNRLKLRAREERARRLALRQKRQDIARAGGHIPPDLLDDSRSHDRDDELDEIDIEMELEIMYGQLEKVLDMVKDSSDAEPFLRPVSAEVAPDYGQIIAKPMDLETMENKLLEREYRNKFDVIEDMNLMLLNCLTYNGIESEYTKLAQRIERVFIRAWKRYFPPSEVLENERIRQDEIKCVDMLGALDKRIRELLKDSDDEEDEPPPPPPVAPKRRTAPANTPRPTYTSAAPSSPQMIAVRPPTSAHMVMQHRNSPQLSTPHRASPSGQLIRPRQPMQATPLSSAAIPPVRRVALSDQGARSLAIQSQPMRTPTSMHTISTLPQRTPQSPEKGNVYLLPGPDGAGNRLFRFVTKDGRPASNELVQLTMPQIRRDVLKFPPKQLVTVTIDDRSAMSAARAQQQQQQQPMMAVNSVPVQRQQYHDMQQPTSSQVRQVRPAASSMVRVVQQQQQQQQQQQPTTSTAMRSTPPSTTVMPIPTASSSPGVSDSPDLLSAQPAHLYNLGQNSFLQVVNGTPFLLRKEQTGGYSRLKKIDKQELVSRLKQLRELKHSGSSGSAVANSIASMGADLGEIATSSNAIESSQPTTATIPISSSTLVAASPTNKAPLIAASKPVCSVAPFASVRSPPMLATATSPQHQSSSSGNSVQLMIPGGQQIIVSGSQPTLLLTSAPTTTSGGGASSHVQYIQLQVPANAQYVVVNSQPNASDDSCQQ